MITVEPPNKGQAVSSTCPLLGGLKNYRKWLFREIINLYNPFKRGCPLLRGLIATENRIL